MVSSRGDVKRFLDKMRDILGSNEFDAEDDLVLIMGRKSGEDQKYSTVYTLGDLEFDAEDVADTLKGLTVQDYSETLLDTADVDPPQLFVFCKEIDRKEVYIKIKVRERTGNVICVSFHYAKYKMSRPYL